MPASLKTRAMYWACATLTQNPRARIATEIEHLVAQLLQDD